MSRSSLNLLRVAGSLAVAATCDACIIEPNQVPDGSVVMDAGDDSDAGPVVDAGVIGGAVSVTVGTSQGISTVAWIGPQLAGSSLDILGAPTQVLVVGVSGPGGNISLYLTNLIPTTTSVGLASIGYQAPSTSPDGWTCSPVPNPTAHCSGGVSVTSYDGHTLIGTFFASFGPEASVMHTSSLSLTNGAFNLTLP